MRLEPRGKLLNVDFKEQPDINIFPKEDDEFYIKNDSPAKATEPNPAYAPKPFTQNMISSQTLNDLTQKLLGQLRNEIAPNTIESNSATLSVADLEAILSTIRLTDSTKLINSVLLQLVCKELYSHMYDIVENNSFFKYLSGAVTKSTQEKKEAFEYLVLKALESYISKK